MAEFCFFPSFTDFLVYPSCINWKSHTWNLIKIPPDYVVIRSWIIPKNKNGEHGRSGSSRRGGAHWNTVGTPFASFYPDKWSRERKKTEKRKKRKKKCISLIYLWCNKGMLNASEQAAVVRLSKKMKCLHSWAGEWKRERRAEPEVVLWQGVNHLASTHTQTTDHQKHHQLSHQHILSI